jgi:superfamily II DNA or RNA helicase
MIDILYNDQDKRYIYLNGDPKELAELEKYMNKIPDYMFLPAFKGEKKPEIFLNKFRTAETGTVYWAYSGLWKTITDWCTSHSVQVTQMDARFKYTGIVPEYQKFKCIVDSWGLNLKPREYQLKAAWLILYYRQSLSQLATRSGKTLIAYIVFRYMLEYCGVHNVLMIVPNISLVKQGVDDMKAFKEFFTTETVWAGSELCDSSNLTIGTFQSLVKRVDPKSPKYDPHFLDKFDVVCCDEAHTAKCASIKKILGQPFIKGLKLKFGFTGTLPKEGSIEDFTCKSLLGPKIQDISSRELMDQGYISDIDITQILVKYPENETLYDTYIRCGEYLCSKYVLDAKKNKIELPKSEQEFTMKHKKEFPAPLKKAKLEIYKDTFEELTAPDAEPKTEDEIRLECKKRYTDHLYEICKSVGSNALMLEQMMIHRSKLRVKVIEELLSRFKKNSIVFAHHTEYLKYLYEHFKERFPERNVYIIYGETSEKKREKIKKSLETDKDAILFASYSCIGTGLTLKNLDYGIFAQSFRSDIINKQSLGRGLMLAQDKDKYRLYDIVDILPTNRLYMQGRSKKKLFEKEKFDTRVVSMSKLGSYLDTQIGGSQTELCLA